MTSLRRGLTETERAEFRSLTDRLEEVLLALPEDAREYFARLVTLARIAVEFRFND
ncbi:MULTISPECIES: hypothetical protein [Microbacterium]|uniref:hypothetical protein n=1 Tax=Microbacterium TaxID=33882 RepID=UPI002AC7BDD3|nr:hypothetical protein [Microbacterium testaceum]MDZ5144427.1 hypothetical protein [Microbacterium testaceum]